MYKEIEEKFSIKNAFKQLFEQTESILITTDLYNGDKILGDIHFIYKNKCYCVEIKITNEKCSEKIFKIS